MVFSPLLESKLVKTTTIQSKVDSLQKRTRLAERLALSLEKAAHTRDLETLLPQVQTLEKKIGKAVKAAKLFQMQRREAAQAHFEMSLALEELAEDCRLSSVKETKSTHELLLSQAEQEQAHFQQAVVLYLTEWHEIVRLYLAYAQQLSVKGRKRNLEEQMPQVAAVLEEICDGSWRDLFPLLNHLGQLAVADHQAHARIMLNCKDDIGQLRKRFEMLEATEWTLDLTDDEDECDSAS